MKRSTIYLLAFPFLLLGLFTFCSSDNLAEDTEATTIEDEEIATQDGFALVTKISSSGNDGNYTFSGTLSSPDTGCDQYANWWEVLDTNGNLLYRRILGHSHTNEQPFTRSGGTVAIQENTEVYVRGHMNNTGYGTRVMRGSIAEGFQSVDVDSDFASNLANEDPLPRGCAF